MTSRRPGLVLAALVSSLSFAAAAERHTTENFVTTAPTKEMARRFGEAAEQYRREKALDWLGYEMPRWPQRCPLVVQVTGDNRAGGATTFTFEGGSRRGVLSQDMKIFGGAEKMLYSVLPHEVTHTVLAHHFGQAVPRWADEGGSVLSENDDERYDHDLKCREVLNAGRGIPLRHLFPMKEYPRDMIVLYAQGYSVTQYLVDLKGKRTFLEFVGQGLRDGRSWDEAVRRHYPQFGSVDELQEGWIAALHKPPVRVAARGPKAGGGVALASRPTDTRTSAITGGLPGLEEPVVARGAMPRDEEKRPARPQPPQPKLGLPEPPRR